MIMVFHLHLQTFSASITLCLRSTPFAWLSFYEIMYVIIYYILAHIYNSLFAYNMFSFQLIRFITYYIQ